MPPGFFTIRSILEQRAAGGGITATAPSARVAALAPGTATEQSDNELFAFVAFRTAEGQLWLKWRAVQATIALEEKTLAECRADRATCVSDPARRFLAILDEAQASRGRSAQIAAVNRLVNSAIRYRSDLEQYGVLDRWSSPLETFATGYGDCEDYAIAKYVALREIGFKTGDLTLVLGNETSIHQDHAVLAVRQGDRRLILDSRRPLPVNENEADTFEPLFALDQEGVRRVPPQFALSRGRGG